MTKHALILADETAFWKIGGLPQIQRQLLNLNEYFSHHNHTDFKITVFWKEDSRRDISSLLRHVYLRDLDIFETEDPLEVVQRIKSDLNETVMIPTDHLFGRKTLIKIFEQKNDYPLKRFHRFGDVDADLFSDHNHFLWEKLALLLTASPETPKEAEKKGYYDYWAVLENSSEISRHEKRMIYYLGKPSDGMMGHIFNRYVSCRVTRRLIKLKITPNQWTFLMFLYFLFGGWCLTLGTYFGFVVGAAIYYSISVLDGCDGEIARITFTESKKGEWFDTVTDMIVNQLFIVLSGFGLMRYFSYSPHAWLYFAEGVVCVVFYMITLNLVNRFVKRHYPDAKNFSGYGELLVNETGAKGPLKNLFYFFTQLVKRDFYTIIILIMVLCDQMDAVLHGLFIGTVANLVPLVGMRRKNAVPTSVSH